MHDPLGFGGLRDESTQEALRAFGVTCDDEGGEREVEQPEGARLGRARGLEAEREDGEQALGLAGLGVEMREPVPGVRRLGHLGEQPEIRAGFARGLLRFRVHRCQRAQVRRPGGPLRPGDRALDGGDPTFEEAALLGVAVRSRDEASISQPIHGEQGDRRRVDGIAVPEHFERSLHEVGRLVGERGRREGLLGGEEHGLHVLVVDRLPQT